MWNYIDYLPHSATWWIAFGAWFTITPFYSMVSPIAWRTSRRMPLYLLQTPFHFSRFPSASLQARISDVSRANTVADNQIQIVAYSRAYRGRHLIYRPAWFPHASAGRGHSRRECQPAATRLRMIIASRATKSLPPAPNENEYASRAYGLSLYSTEFSTWLPPMYSPAFQFTRSVSLRATTGFPRQMDRLGKIFRQL